MTRLTRRAALVACLAGAASAAGACALPPLFEADAVQALLGSSWTVSRIGGVELPRDIAVTLAFGRDGVLSGLAGCNLYRAGYQLEGQGLTLSQAVTTRMACSQEVAQIEQLWLGTLPEIARVLHESGSDTLVLETGAGTRVLARAQVEG